MNRKVKNTLDSRLTKGVRNYTRRFFFLLIMCMISVVQIQAQKGIVISINNQKIDGSNFKFDLYLRANDASAIHLGNADFVFTFNSASFTNPVLSKLGSAQDSISLTPTNSTTANQTLTRTNYFNNTSTYSIVGNEIVINLDGPSPADQAAFNSSVARIDNTPILHRLGSFQISGYTGGVNELQWKLTGNGLLTQIFDINNTVPFVASSANITTQSGLPSFLDIPNTLVQEDANFLACDSIRSRAIYQNGTSTTDINYQAKISITLLSGFEVRQGVIFSATMVDNCPNATFRYPDETRYSKVNPDHRALDKSMDNSEEQILNDQSIDNKPSKTNYQISFSAHDKNNKHQ